MLPRDFSFKSFSSRNKKRFGVVGFFFVLDCLQYLHTDIKLKSCSGPHLQREVKIMHRVSSLDCTPTCCFCWGFFYLVMALKKYVLSCAV